MREVSTLRKRTYTCNMTENIYENAFEKACADNDRIDEMRFLLHRLNTEVSGRPTFLSVAQKIAIQQGFILCLNADANQIPISSTSMCALFYLCPAGSEFYTGLIECIWDEVQEDLSFLLYVCDELV